MSHCGGDNGLYPLWGKPLVALADSTSGRSSEKAVPPGTGPNVLAGSVGPYGDLLVAEPLLDYLWVDVPLEEQSGVSVPEIVEAQPPEARVPGQVRHTRGVVKEETSIPPGSDPPEAEKKEPGSTRQGPGWASVLATRVLIALLVRAACCLALPLCPFLGFPYYPGFLTVGGLGTCGPSTAGLPMWRRSLSWTSLPGAAWTLTGGSSRPSVWAK